MKLSIVLSLCGSLALGGAALLVARVWLPSGTPEVEAAEVAAINTMPVVVAAADLPYGTRLDAASLTLRQFPADAVPPGAFSSIDAVLASDEGGPLALMPLVSREVILPAKISGPGSRPSVAIQIREGMRAYAIAVSDQSAVGGNALPGDWVDVVLSRETDPDRSDRGMVSEVVIQNVRLLGMDLNADPSSVETQVPSTATLEVNLEDAQKLALASQLGLISLVLRPTGQTDLAESRGVRVADIGPTGPRAIAPVRVARPAVRSSRPAQPAAAPVAPATRTITIVSGGEATSVDVPAERVAQGDEG